MVGSLLKDAGSCILNIVSIVKEKSLEGYRHRDLVDIDTLVVHRCGKDLIYNHDFGDTAQEICDVFLGRVPKYAAVARAVGSKVPYSFIIGGNLGASQWDGVLWQCLPMHVIGPHARAWNSRGIGIGIIADPRKQEPSEAQRATLVRLLALLCMGLRLDASVAIRSHDSLVEGSTDTRKRCPGDLLSMTEIRTDVVDAMEDRGLELLKSLSIAL